MKSKWIELLLLPVLLMGTIYIVFWEDRPKPVIIIDESDIKDIVFQEQAILTTLQESLNADGTQLDIFNNDYAIIAKEKIFRIIQSEVIRENAAAMYYTGVAYEHGFGVIKNQLQAQNWYARSAIEGFFIGQYKIASLILAEELLDPVLPRFDLDQDDDYRKKKLFARDMLTEAAFLGYADAQILLSIFYHDDPDFEDAAQSYIWQLIAHANGWDPLPEQVRKNLQVLTQSETLEAQAIAIQYWNEIIIGIGIQIEPYTDQGA